MNNESILDRVRIASPCSARWEDMSGDERARFCQHCRKHVFNLSAMSRAEAEQLVREKDGKFCGRFYQRRDGRMLTGNCPVGERRRRSRLVKICAAGFAVFAILGTALATGMNERKGQRGAFAQKVDGWIYDAKVKLGIIQPPAMVGKISMGQVVVTPPVSSSTVTNGGK